MNLDKTIKELTNRLDVVHPYSSYSSINHQNSNDGVNYWKGKKIISVKDWNELYEKKSTYTDTYKSTLTSGRPLQYFPDDYNSSISSLRVINDELKEAADKWNKDYYELLEYRKNPTWGRMKCTKCLLSGSLDDPIFIGIEKVFVRIVGNQCNDNAANNYSDRIITYHCNVMNIFSCPFERKEESYNNSTDAKDEKAKYPYKREDLFSLHQISFAIEQAITTFFEITKQNEIIFEVDFENDKVQKIYTKYNGEPESWGWNDDVNGQLSTVKPISNIVIRDEQDIYDIVTNREKLEFLLKEYKKKNNHRLANEGEQLQVCCDENTPCVNSNNGEKLLTNNIISIGSSQSQLKYQDNVDYLHKGENRHSKNTGEGELSNEKLISNLKIQIKDELEKQEKEQQILLKQNKQNIINFLLDNKDSIRIEDMKIYEPVYKCYREKGNCYICNSLSNTICKNCSNYKNEIWLCTSHWEQHAIDSHEQE